MQNVRWGQLKINNMGNLNQTIENHYLKERLFEDIINRLSEQGIDLNNVIRADIAGVDEFHVRGAAVSKELANSIPLKGANVLDVGCGNGLFLLEAKKRGWNVFGTEFTDDAVEFCKSNGIDMKKGSLNPGDFVAGQFDIVTSFEVIEHINNPLEESLNFHQLLRKGGLLYITTPNFNCVERFILGPSYDIIEYPEHISYYTARTLRLLFEAQGFQTRKMEATNIDFSKFKASKNSSGNTASSDMRESVEGSVILRSFKVLVNGILNFFNIGNALKGWFIKT